MKSAPLLWIIAFFITLLTAYYQRVTGPTYPLSGEAKVGNTIIKFKLGRTHGGKGDQEIKIAVPDSSFHGSLFFKRYKTNDRYTQIPMKYSGGYLSAYLPHQPPAGKLEYFIRLQHENHSVNLPQNKTVVTRFKGAVPLAVLIPHIFFMFGAMLLSARTGLEYFAKKSDLRKLTYWTIGFLFIGGFILGPLVQQYAFGDLWTGIPFGWDLTDNKTLIAMIGWLVALFMYRKSANPHKWALFAAILLILVYLIPHSAMGSELDYNKLDKMKNHTSSFLIN